MATPIQPLPRDAAEKLDEMIMEGSNSLQNARQVMKDKNLQKDDLYVLVYDLTATITQMILTGKSIKTK